MVFFVIFVFAAVIIGIGVMLAPVFDTAQPRVGLASTVALAIIIGGGILWTGFVKWDTLVIDYLLFGLVSLVILGGTMAQAHQQATSDEDIDTSIEWMTKSDFLFFVLIGFLCLIPLFLPNIPPETSSIDITMAIREGEAFSDIAIDYPQLQNFGAIGFHVLSAYLSQQLQQDIVIVQLAISSGLAFLCILTAYDFGAEIRNIVLGRFFAVGMLIILGIGFIFFSDFYNSLMGLLFIVALLIFAIRAFRHRQWQDILGAIFLLCVIVVGM